MDMNNSYNLSVRNPILQTSNYPSPETTRLTLEQEYSRLANKMTPQQTTSNAYSTYINILNSCADVTRERIMNDERFTEIYTQCENYLKEYLYAQAIPYVLETQQGRIAFEQLSATTKALKEEYNQRDLQKERQLELLMNDEVVLRRLQELQSEQEEPKPSAPPRMSKTVSQPKKNKPNTQPQQQIHQEPAVNEVVY